MKQRSSTARLAILLTAVLGCAGPSSPPGSGEPVAGDLDGVPAEVLAGLERRPWTCPPAALTVGRRLAYDVRTAEGQRLVEADAASATEVPFTLERSMRFEYEVTTAPVTSAEGATRLRVTLTRLEQRGPRAADLEGLTALVGVPFTLTLDPRGAPVMALVGPAIERCFGAEAALTGAGLGADAAGLLSWCKLPFDAVPRGRSLAPGDRWADRERGREYRYVGSKGEDEVRLWVETPDVDGTIEWVVRPAIVVRLTTDGVPIEQPDVPWSTRRTLSDGSGRVLEASGAAGFRRAVDLPG